MRKLPARPGIPGARLALAEDPIPSIGSCEAIRNRLALPVPEVAKLLGISSAAVRNMIARGDLPGRKIGGGADRITYIVPTHALLVWLEGTGRSQPEDAA